MTQRLNQRQIARENVEKFNRRLPEKLDAEQHKLAKKLRKPRNDDLFESLRQIYGYLDRVYAFTKGLIACKKGCSFCCHIQVQITQVEANYIAAHAGVEARQSPKNDLIPPAKGSWVDPRRPCPFLKNDECSIYEYRPLACRVHVNFEATNEVCRFGAGEVPMDLIDKETSFPAIMTTLRHLNAGQRIADIREFFGNKSLGERLKS